MVPDECFEIPIIYLVWYMAFDYTKKFCMNDFDVCWRTCELCWTV